jgi:hypothetical protein
MFALCCFCGSVRAIPNGVVTTWKHDCVMLCAAATAAPYNARVVQKGGKNVSHQHVRRPQEEEHAEVGGENWKY